MIAAGILMQEHEVMQHLPLSLYGNKFAFLHVPHKVQFRIISSKAECAMIVMYVLIDVCFVYIYYFNIHVHVCCTKQYGIGAYSHFSI
jgi:hypothetical protein